MQAIIEFINSNYQLLIIIASGVIEFILLLIFKKRSLLIDSSVYKDVVILVCEAERKFGSGHGAEKLEYVLDRFFDVRYGSVNGFAAKNFRGVIKGVIEEVLSTPSKK